MSGHKYHTGSYEGFYPTEGTISLYPGSSTVVRGHVYGKEPQRLDFRLERAGLEYIIGLLGSQSEAPKALCDSAHGALELYIGQANNAVSQAHDRVPEVRADFMRRFYGILLEGNLAVKTDFSGFKTPGKVYVSFNQFQYR